MLQPSDEGDECRVALACEALLLHRQPTQIAERWPEGVVDELSLQCAVDAYKEGRPACEVCMWSGEWCLASERDAGIEEVYFKGPGLGAAQIWRGRGGKKGRGRRVRREGRASRGKGVALVGEEE